MLVASALLDEKPHPSEAEVRWAISGNLCRCTGYQNIVKAIQYAANTISSGSDSSVSDSPVSSSSVSADVAQ